jgi:hypothetical protein
MPALAPSNQLNPSNRLSDDSSSIGSPALANNLPNTPTDTLKNPSTPTAALPSGPAYLPSSPFSQPRNSSLAVDKDVLPEIDNTPPNTATSFVGYSQKHRSRVKLCFRTCNVQSFEQLRTSTDAAIAASINAAVGTTVDAATDAKE